MGSVEAVLAERLLSLSLEQKVRLLTGADFWSLHPEPDVGLRRLVLSDGPAGVRGERWDESIHVGHRDTDRRGIEPAFWLGYTLWDYLDAQVMPEANGDVMVKVRVRTTWPRPGREIVQVYAARGEGLVERPTRWLAGFTGMDVEPGTFQLQVGWSSQDLPICADVAFPATAGTSPLGPG
jgi:hypothetical protein